VLGNYEQVHGIRAKFYDTMHLQQPYTSAADDAELEESLSPGRHLCILFTHIVPRAGETDIATVDTVLQAA
jgi:hypothetical protein